ncbi:hypothetical protein C8Q80DRAFT_1274972 [Daedaleopsis nitida]|nr:hypothetical protein C8Q80DRAFT_1274972 [Daedaleopsis nitida]
MTFPFELRAIEDGSAPGIFESAYVLRSYLDGLWTHFVVTIFSTVCFGIFSALFFFSTVVFMWAFLLISDSFRESTLTDILSQS